MHQNSSGFPSNFEYAKDIRIYGMLNWLNSLLGCFQKDRFIWTKKVSFRSYFGTCIGAIIGFSSWLNNIVENISDIVAKGIKIGYYRDYFNIKENYNHGQGRALPSENELPLNIEFCNVSYKYPSADDTQYTLKNINLKINSGERIAVVGQNAAGKTTFAKLLCGFYFSTEGTVKVNGNPITEYNIEDYYTLFSAVFQDIYLLSVTISDFVSSSDAIANAAKVKSVIEKAGFQEKIHA